MQPSPADRCPVCGMAVLGRKFGAGIERRDAQSYYFCSGACMLEAWRQPEIFLGCKHEALRRAVTREYFSGLCIDAARAYWVAGSDVLSAMGPAIVALKDEADLAVFQRRHAGSLVFRLRELDAAMWQQIMGVERAKKPAAAQSTK